MPQVIFKENSCVQGKLNEALVKLNEEKPCDAVGKLNDFIAKVQQLAIQHGLPYADPAWLPEVIERYGLTAPPPRPAPAP